MDKGQIFQILSAVFGVLAIIFGFLGSAITEKGYIKTLTQFSKELIGLDKKFEKRMTESDSKLEQLQKSTGPRHLPRETFLNALKGGPKENVEILYSKDDPDSLEFAQEIEGLLKEAGWNVIRRDPIPQVNTDLPLPMTVKGQPSGITIALRGLSTEEHDAFMNKIVGKSWVKTPYTVLSDAFGQANGEVKTWTDQRLPNDLIRIVVAPRR